MPTTKFSILNKKIELKCVIHVLPVKESDLFILVQTVESSRNAELRCSRAECVEPLMEILIRHRIPASFRIDEQLSQRTNDCSFAGTVFANYYIEAWIKANFKKL